MFVFGCRYFYREYRCRLILISGLFICGRRLAYAWKQEEMWGVGLCV